jgi:hypothetical protein
MDDPRRHAQDRQRINIHQDYELDHWTTALGVSREELKELVDQHGDRPADIRRALSRMPA